VGGTADGVSVGEGVGGTADGVSVGDGVGGTGVGVSVADGVREARGVRVGDGVLVGVGVERRVLVGLGVADGVAVGVSVGMSVGVTVDRSARIEAAVSAGNSVRALRTDGIIASATIVTSAKDVNGIRRFGPILGGLPPTAAVRPSSATTPSVDAARHPGLTRRLIVFREG
jgi:hypothetical protein